MKVMFRTTATGPDAHFLSGKVYELPLVTAKPFLDGGYAFEVTADADGKWQPAPTVPKLVKDPEAVLTAMGVSAGGEEKAADPAETDAGGDDKAEKKKKK